MLPMLSLLRAFHEQSEGRTHATLLVTGYLKLENNTAANGAHTNGDAHMNDLEDENAYVSELKTIQEAQPEEMQCIMLVPEDELEGQ